LKYFSPDTDLSALQSELGGNPRLEEDLEKWPEFTAEESAAESDDEAQSA
jgi:hypothetical protein